MLYVLFPLLILAAIVGGIVYGIVILTRRGRDFGEADTGIGTVRRLYFYTVTFMALIMAASGVTEIAHYVLDAITDTEIDGPSRIRLATGLSLTIVGLPLWGFHWRLIARQLNEIPVETRSVLRKVYFYLVLAVAAAITMTTAITVLQWLLSNRSFSGYSMAGVVVWAGVWAFHWRMERDEGQPTPETLAIRRLYLYLVAAGTLITASTGIGILVGGILTEAYDAIASVKTLGGTGLWSSSAKIALSLVLVPGGVWAAHWLYFARRDYDSTLRQLYLYGLTILGGLVTVLFALGLIIGDVLVWTIGVPDQPAAADHFGFLPWALASLFVGGGVLAYHLYAARAEEEVSELGARGAPGSFPYLLALIGLVMLAVAIVTVVTTAIGVLVESDRTALVGADLWRNQLAVGITLGLLGGPLWGYFWAAVQRRVREEGVAEQASLPRRQFTFAVLGIGMIALVVSVSFFLFVFLRELLDGDLSQVLPDTKGSIGVIVAAAIFVPYHWMVYRSDRRATTELEGADEEPRARKAVTALVDRTGAAFLAGLEAALGYKISVLDWADTGAGLPEMSEAALEELAQRVGDAAGPNVLLVPDDDTIRVLSYR